MRHEWMKALCSTGAPEPASSPRTVAHAESVLGQEAVAWAVEAAIAINDEVEAAAHADARLPLTGLELPACEAGSPGWLSDHHEGAAEIGGILVWHRLREVKTRYDPDNVFRHCPNIPPLTGGAADA